MSKKASIAGICKICGEESKLTREHYLPQSAGGGRPTKFYDSDELIGVISKGAEYVPYGKINQTGYSKYSLCKDCNSALGASYDKDFAQFYGFMNSAVAKSVVDSKVTNPAEIENLLMGRSFEVKDLPGQKPMNIAKRILASMCSISMTSLAEDDPEIRKAIMDTAYKPNIDKFSLYMIGHYGSLSLFGPIVLGHSNGAVEAITGGMELGYLAFYIAPHNEHKKEGVLARCIDITNWLTDYGYDEEVEMTINLNFEQSFALNAPLPEY